MLISTLPDTWKALPSPFNPKFPSPPPEPLKLLARKGLAGLPPPCLFSLSNLGLLGGYKELN